MNASRELSVDECRELICGAEFGRVAVCTPSGPRIVPVNYKIMDDSIVFRTSPYSLVGMRGWPTELAFEVDQIDTQHRNGWSVVASGPGQMVEDWSTLATIRLVANPQPWVDGSRNLYIRLAWTSLTGRQIGASGNSAIATVPGWLGSWRI